MREEVPKNNLSHIIYCRVSEDRSYGCVFSASSDLVPEQHSGPPPPRHEEGTDLTDATVTVSCCYIRQSLCVGASFQQIRLHRSDSLASAGSEPSVCVSVSGLVAAAGGRVLCERRCYGYKPRPF